MHEQDELIAKIQSKKNEIETYIYAKRSQCQDKEPLLSKQERDEILKLLEEAEQWLVDINEEQATLDALSSKLSQLQEACNKAGPKLYEQLLQEELQRKKATEEDREYMKNYKPESKVTTPLHIHLPSQGT